MIGRGMNPVGAGVSDKAECVVLLSKSEGDRGDVARQRGKGLSACSRLNWDLKI